MKKRAFCYLSIMMCSMLVVAVVLPVTCAAQTVALVQGSSSAPNAAECNYSASITRRLSRWLNDLNVEHKVIDDEAVAAGRLRGVSVAVLVYNPYPGRREMAELTRFVKRGGKLIVFFSSSSELAGLLGMKLGEYTPASRPGQWASFTFNRPMPRYLPKTIFQDSRCIRPVFPRDRNARTIAHWRSDSQKVLSDPAWVLSDRGLWMSHVLLKDDSENKKRMLLALLGYCDPDIWRQAATASVSTAGRIGTFKDYDEAVRTIQVHARATRREKQVEPLLVLAARLHRELPQVLAAGKYSQTVEMRRRLNLTLTEAYARTQRSRRGEFRGVWEHSGVGPYPGDWDKTCRILAEHGMTAVLPNMLWPGLAHYKSRTLPQSEISEYYGDQVAQCVRAARKHRIQVHIWKVCWNLDSASDHFVQKLRKERRLQVTDKGKTIKWLCPSNPDNVKMEIDAILEVVKHYPIDGIHLDYVRYPDSHSCYCQGCKRRFEKEIGNKIGNWPTSVRRGQLAKTYNAWRCGRITEFVKLVGESVRDVRPRAQISAAVFGKYPACVGSVAQDWPVWINKGYVDFVCPMNYFPENERFAAFTRSQMPLAKRGGKIFPGIGVTAAESRLDAAQTLEQIDIIRREGAFGFVLFDLNNTVEKEILPMLSLGVTAD